MQSSGQVYLNESLPVALWVNKFSFLLVTLSRLRNLLNYNVFIQKLSGLIYDKHINVKHIKFLFSYLAR